ncbi:MAG: response regulator [Blautia sp.]|nr:response regulator [Lachnoclostridium sp.]MCM1212425.1 response regulator [Blautia sp.]
MKFRVLVSGKNNPIIDDFFIQMDDCFEVVSTSIRFGDVVRHLKYFSPDAFIYCIYNESQDVLRQMSTIKHALAQSRVPFILIGSKEDCDEFEKVAVNVANMTIVKPFTAISIREKIWAFLDERKDYVAAYRKEPEKEDVDSLVASRENDAADISLLKEKLSLLEDALTAPAPAAAKTPASSGTTQAAAAKVPAASGTPTAAAPGQPAPEQALEPEERKHILVVDDSPMMLKMLKEQLHDNYDVATAVSGKIALKFLERKKTDLILLDFEMPEENGPAVLEKIRAVDSLKDIPVVFLTGVSEREKIREALVLKPQSYLLKPIDRDKLLDTIASVMNH